MAITIINRIWKAHFQWLIHCCMALWRKRGYNLIMVTEIIIMVKIITESFQN